MKMRSGLILVFLLAGLMPALSLAQEQPPEPRPPRDEMRGNTDRPPRPLQGDDRDRPMRPSMGQFDMLRGYLELVDRYSRMARDPSVSGVAAVITSNEMLKARGTDAAIAYFVKLLPEAKNEAVQRAIRLQLVELYKTSGQQDKALEQLQVLIVSAPPVSAEPAPAVPAPNR